MRKGINSLVFHHTVGFVFCPNCFVINTFGSDIQTTWGFYEIDHRPQVICISIIYKIMSYKKIQVLNNTLNLMIH